MQLKIKNLKWFSIVYLISRQPVEIMKLQMFNNNSIKITKQNTSRILSILLVRKKYFKNPFRFFQISVKLISRKNCTFLRVILLELEHYMMLQQESRFFLSHFRRCLRKLNHPAPFDKIIKNNPLRLTQISVKLISRKNCTFLRVILLELEH